MDTLDNYANAIAAVESDGSGGYGAVGPATHTGDRAYGRYQIMGSNIPQWTQAATGTALTPGQFLANSDAQDKTFKHHFGNLVNQYGNPQDAASAWFTGRPQSRGGNASDGYITGNEYVRRFNNALSYAGEGSGSDNEPALKAINSAIKSPTGSPMADQGALNTKQTLGNGVLGGMGPALQDAGSYLMGLSPYTKPPDANHSANFLKEAGMQIIDGGQDMFGRKILYTMKNGQLSPLQVNKGPAGPGGVTDYGSPSSMTQGQFEGLKEGFRTGQVDRDTVLKQTGMIGDFAKAMAEGKSDPRMMGMKAGPVRLAAMDLAHTLYPDVPFDENSISGRQAFNRLMATGSTDPSKLPGALVSASKLSEHALQVAKTSKDVSDLQTASGVPLANMVQNAVESKVGRNSIQDALNALETISDTYSGEQDRLATGGHPTLTGHETVMSRFSADKTHSSRMRGLGESLDAALAPLEQMVHNKNALFGENKQVEDYLSPETKGNIAQVRKLIAEGTTRTAPKPTGDTRPPLSSFLPR